MRRSALHTWRYYAEYCTEEHNWLIPDNVQEEPPAVAGRVSPTNLGMLLNAQQVACEFGYLTVPELAVQTQRTSRNALSHSEEFAGTSSIGMTRARSSRLTPRFVSSVDSGNLLASLWTLQQGLLTRMKQPLLQPSMAEGVLDHLRALAELKGFSRRQAFPLRTRPRHKRMAAEPARIVRRRHFTELHPSPIPKSWRKSRRFSAATRARLQAVQELVSSYTPWELPEFASVRNDIKVGPELEERPSLRQLPLFIDDLHNRLERVMPSLSLAAIGANTKSCKRLLPQARANALRLIETLRTVAVEAGKLADAMEFSFLLNPRRKLMSVGFNVETGKLEPACYDLLATESRTAVFAAVAKEDIPQESWFRMGRTHTIANGNPVLRSWTGTMFEYLMPMLWMRSYPNTLLDRSRIAVVDYQQTYASRKGVPVGHFGICLLQAR